MGHVHIYAPVSTRKRIIAGVCPTCARWTRFIGLFYEWYGWHETCLRCGDQWSDGELLERPFARGWRQCSIDAAKEHYRAALAEGEVSDATYN